MLLLAQIKFADLRSRNTVSGSGSVVKTCQVDSQTTPSCVDAVQMLCGPGGTWLMASRGVLTISGAGRKSLATPQEPWCGVSQSCVSIDPLDC